MTRNFLKRLKTCFPKKNFWTIFRENFLSPSCGRRVKKKLVSDDSRFSETPKKRFQKKNLTIFLQKFDSNRPRTQYDVDVYDKAMQA